MCAKRTILLEKEVHFEMTPNNRKAMKKFAAAALLAALLASCLPALAEQPEVPPTPVVTQAPTEEAPQAEPSAQTEPEASPEAEASSEPEAPAEPEASPEAEPQATAEPAQAEWTDVDAQTRAASEDALTLRAVNAKIRFLDANGRPAGEEYTDFDFSAAYANPVTGESCQAGTLTARIIADESRKDDIDYWMIDGVPFYFSSKVWFITVEGLDQGMTFEVVYKGETPTTAKSSATVAEALVLSGYNARVQFVNDKREPDGKRFKSVDFTNEYTNLATKETLPGGEISARVESMLPDGKRVIAWEINGVTFRFNIGPRYITVMGLDKAMHFEPKFGS